MNIDMDKVKQGVNEITEKHGVKGYKIAKGDEFIYIELPFITSKLFTELDELFKTEGHADGDKNRYLKDHAIDHTILLTYEYERYIPIEGRFAIINQEFQKNRGGMNYHG